MAFLYFKFAVPLLSLFMALMLVIHAQVYDDSRVREFLLPDGCAMPCFMGIRPGVTTVDEATSILERSGWVKNLTMPPQYASRDDNVIIWQWNDAFPVRALHTLDEAPYGNFLAVKGDLVDSLVVATSITLADIELSWETPAQYIATTTTDDHLYYGRVYPQQKVYVVGISRCPYYPNFWRHSTNMVIGAAQKYFLAGFVPNDRLFLRQVIESSQKSCGR